MDKTLSEFKTLVEIVAKLRGPNGCPWDKEQNQKSLTKYIIEETHELVEAIESEVQSDIKEELGDHLFQTILQAQVAQDEGHFQLSDVIEVLCKKLIRRHPHVFNPTLEKPAKAHTSEEISQKWQEIKTQEKSASSEKIFSFPKSLPSLQASAKIGHKTKSYGFDWNTPEQVYKKIQEEALEVEETLTSKDRHEQEHEIGDLLFSAAQLARHLDLDPEACLREANRRFEKRFLKTLELSHLSKEDFAKLSDQQKENLWQEAKRQTR
jgi:tetrapyrrole methylase family protein/MazG family protein